ncbi:putative copper-binding protein PcoE [Escherichia coli]|nr:putative copper-binding protein PcoE [Escherichia coli]
MKKILVSFVAIMAVASSAMAAETMNMHDQVNNAQHPPIRCSQPLKSAVQGDSDNDGYEHDDQAAMSHEMMQNGNASAHQTWRRCIKMMKGKPGPPTNQQRHFQK